MSRRVQVQRRGSGASDQEPPGEHAAVRLAPGTGTQLQTCLCVFFHAL